MNYIEIEKQFTSGVYYKRNVCFVRGEGARLWDIHGKEYLDFAAGISVANLGHAHPSLIAAVTRQARTLMTSPELAYNDRCAQLLERLAAVTPAGINRFFLCNSGTEAIEGCIKFAHFSTGRPKFIAAMRAFHGRTIGSLAATHQKKYREPFVALCPPFDFVPFNNVPKLTAAIDDRTAGVLIELVQGEGGIRPADAEFVHAVRSACNDHGALMIVDEVQTGFGRTGALFACHHYDVRPDLMAMGKAMAGGVPMGAVGIGDNVRSLEVALHGSTFGGNPLACAAALANLDVLKDERLPEKAGELGVYFLQRLRQIDSPMIREVRGQGLMLAVELKQLAAPILQALLDRGFLVVNAGPTALRFLPPLVIQRSQIDALADALSDILAEVPVEV